MGKFSQSELDEINKTIHGPKDALKWAFDNLGSRVAKASSFGAEDSVLIHMITRINPNARFFTLDTGRLNPETYDLMAKFEKEYGIKFEVQFPDAAEVEEMVKEKGINLFYDSVENRQLCCGIRKVKPLQKILATLDGWITGIRRDQTSIRRDASYLEIDIIHDDIIKINPLLEWTWDDVQGYIREHDILHHPLLDRGFPSIGCAPCTRAIGKGEDLRAGRWWWESKEHKECGLHVDHGVT